LTQAAITALYCGGEEGGRRKRDERKRWSGGQEGDGVERERGKLKSEEGKIETGERDKHKKIEIR
jgi:hypothetical protein